MTDKEKTIKELKEVLDNLDITNKYRLNLIRAIEYLQEEPVSDDFKLFEKEYLEKEEDEILCVYDRHAGLVDGAQWQKLQMIEKACKWLDENAAKYLVDKSVHGVKMTGLDTSFTEDFKKAMKA